MTAKPVSIIGSGIAGAAIAHLLCKQGQPVELFEKGPEYPYLHAPVFEETQVMYEPESSSLNAPTDLKNHTIYKMPSPHNPHSSRRRNAAAAWPRGHWSERQKPNMLSLCFPG